MTLPPTTSSASLLGSLSPPSITTKPRSTSGSRNDLFNTSWKPEVPPPRPIAELSTDPLSNAIAGPSTSTSITSNLTSTWSSFVPSTTTSSTPASSFLTSSTSSGSSNGFSSGATVRGAVSGGVRGDSGSGAAKNLVNREFPTTSGVGNLPAGSGSGSAVTTSSTATSSTIGLGHPPTPTTAIPARVPEVVRTPPARNESPKTSSFFDVSIPSSTPPPAPRLSSSLGIASASAASSTASPAPLHALQPAPASTSASSLAPTPLNFSRASSPRRAPPPALPLYDKPPQSSLHHSPSWSPSRSWAPPLPPSSDDIRLRLRPEPSYLLGEGRYARVYLAAFRRERERDPRCPGLGRLEEGKSKWALCAAKRLAQDRESQTMGLREAFFLNRLSGAPHPSTAVTSSSSSSKDGSEPSPSPLRDNQQEKETTSSERLINGRPLGSVFVIKLIAVKEDYDDNVRGSSETIHGRSISDARGSLGQSSGVNSSTKRMIRNRSSTFATCLANAEMEGKGSNRSVEWNDRSPVGDTNPSAGTSSGALAERRENILGSFPSLPALGTVARDSVTDTKHDHSLNKHGYGMDHPNATPSLSRLVLVLEHAPLGTLDRLLRTSPALVGRELWGRWAREGAEVLAWVHEKGIVHADVKPGNLLLTMDLHLRLSDFGSSLLVDPNHPPTDGLGLGTLPFSPPELVDPSRPFSFPVDIFAFGATLYQCITGREPYRGSRSVEIMHHVRKGGLWAWEERERLGRIGAPSVHGASVAPSPYPSAWRDETAMIAGAGGGPGVKRGGSLRVSNHYQHTSSNDTPNSISGSTSVTSASNPATSGTNPHHHTQDHRGFTYNTFPHAPRLSRMASADSVRASDDAAEGPADASPAGVRLWANWIKTNQNQSTHISSSNNTSPNSVISNNSSRLDGGCGRGWVSDGSPVTKPSGIVSVGSGADAIARLLADDDYDTVGPSSGSQPFVQSSSTSTSGRMGVGKSSGASHSSSPISPIELSPITTEQIHRHLQHAAYHPTNTATHLVQSRIVSSQSPSTLTLPEIESRPTPEHVQTMASSNTHPSTLTCSVITTESEEMDQDLSQEEESKDASGRERRKDSQVSVKSTTSTTSVHSASPSIASTTSTMAETAARVRAELAVLTQSYASDGAPAMLFLDGTERVEESVRKVIRSMVEGDPEKRPTAKELVKIWDELGVGLG